MSIHIESGDGGSSVEKSSTNVEKSVHSSTSKIAFHDSGEHISIEIDMPGISVDGLDVTLTGRRLTARYTKNEERHSDDGGEESTVVVEETISKEVDLPVDVDPQTVDAVYKRGTLIVKVRKKSIEDEPGERVSVNVK